MPKASGIYTTPDTNKTRSAKKSFVQRNHEAIFLLGILPQQLSPNLEQDNFAGEELYCIKQPIYYVDRGERVGPA